MVSDSELLSRFRNGDKEAFGELVLRHEKIIYSMCLRAVGDHDEASDLAQMTFVRAYRAAPGFRETSGFKTWLYRIALNLLKNYWRDRSRKRKTELTSEVAAVEPSAIDRVSNEDALAFVWNQAVKLPGKQKATLILRGAEGMSYREIAQILGISEGAAKVNYHQAVRKLRAVWQKSGE